MKKILCLIAFIMLSCQISLARDVSRVIMKDAKIDDIAKITSKFIDIYDNALINEKKDNKTYSYSAELAAGTLLSYIGTKAHEGTRYSKAMFAVNYEQKGNDVIGTARKTIYSGWFGSASVFNHYKKLWQEIEFQGYSVEPIASKKGVKQAIKSYY